MFELATVLTDDCSVHVIERIAEQFDPLTIGTGEVVEPPGRRFEPLPYWSQVAVA